ncbi:hypothetical protein DPV78_001638 [Talaromyces pinophilus]|nr:hypothetical protein DPV78_001638 [Talaromyces pinophilus]
MSQSATESDIEPITDLDGECDSDSDTLKCNWEHSFDGHTKVKIDEQLTEVVDVRMVTMHVLTLARMLPSNQLIIVKIRYELDPKEFLINGVEENKGIVSNHVGLEADLVDLVYSSVMGLNSLTWLHTIKYRDSHSQDAECSAHSQSVFLEKN